MTILDGKKLRDKILEKVKTDVASLDFQPVFCDVLVGDDPASTQYVQMKAKTAEMVGIHFYKATFPASISTDDLIKEIKILNKIENMCGIIVQLPLPESIDKRAILDSIDPHLDVDCLGTVASEKFYNNYDKETDLAFPTALACMTLLDSINLLDLKQKIIVVLGRGELVGKPVSALLKFRGLNHIVVRSKTPARNAYGEAVAGGENKEYLLKQADVIISGIGKAKYITGNMIKIGAILIDAGTSESLERSSTSELTGGIVGDVDFESVKDVASFISPVPGGVGPVTVAMLLNNILKVAKNLK